MEPLSPKFPARGKLRARAGSFRERLRDAISLIEANIRNVEGTVNRALTGLSMGGRDIRNVMA